MPEQQIKARYEPTLLEHSGIRMLEPELFDDYDPHRKMFLRAVALQHDVGPLEVSEAEAEQFMRQHGAEKCNTWRDEESGQVSVVGAFDVIQLCVCSTCSLAWSRLACSLSLLRW